MQLSQSKYTYWVFQFVHRAFGFRRIAKSTQPTYNFATAEADTDQGNQLIDATIYELKQKK